MSETHNGDDAATWLFVATTVMPLWHMMHPMQQQDATHMHMHASVQGGKMKSESQTPDADTGDHC
jgi:hypothetical protein